MYASKNGNFEVVKLLIENKSNIEKANDFLKTPLMYAIENDHIEVVKILMQAGANINT